MISVWGLGAWDMRHVWVRGIVTSILSGLCTALGLGFICVGFGVCSLGLEVEV